MKSTTFALVSIKGPSEVAASHVSSMHKGGLRSFKVCFVRKTD